MMEYLLHQQHLHLNVLDHSVGVSYSGGKPTTESFSENHCKEVSYSGGGLPRTAPSSESDCKEVSK